MRSKMEVLTFNYIFVYVFSQSTYSNCVFRSVRILQSIADISPLIFSLNNNWILSEQLTQLVLRK